MPRSKKPVAHKPSSLIDSLKGGGDEIGFEDKTFFKTDGDYYYQNDPEALRKENETIRLRLAEVEASLNKLQLHSNKQATVITRAMHTIELIKTRQHSHTWVTLPEDLVESARTAYNKYRELFGW